jgi:acetyltransferase-like isoleucine patch superfamily enzyme
MRRLEVQKSGDGVNSLWRWYRYQNPLRVAFNLSVIYLCRYAPSMRLKNAMYRFIGMKVGKNVSVGLGVVFDVFFPELIELGDNSIIGFDSTILAHEFLVTEFRKGQVKVGKNVLIGARSLILPGVEIGDGARVSAMSLVNADVAAGSFVGGVPVKEIK